jgi:hypothetical protein
MHRNVIRGETRPDPIWTEAPRVIPGGELKYTDLKESVASKRRAVTRAAARATEDAHRGQRACSAGTASGTYTRSRGAIEHCVTGLA